MQEGEVRRRFGRDVIVRERTAGGRLVRKIVPRCDWLLHGNVCAKAAGLDSSAIPSLPSSSRRCEAFKLSGKDNAVRPSAHDLFSLPTSAADDQGNDREREANRNLRCKCEANGWCETKRGVGAKTHLNGPKRRHLIQSECKHVVQSPPTRLRWVQYDRIHDPPRWT